MSLQEIKFEVKLPKGSDKIKTIDKSWSHIGVVGSGDLEILFTKSDSQQVKVKIVTPVKGFDDIWKAVVERFVIENNLAGFDIDINDNNATPFIVTLRLGQALKEALDAAGGASGE